MVKITSLEICAGAGGQALGLEQAGFNHVGLVEIHINACNTLTTNRPGWDVIQNDLREFSAKKYYGIDLLAGGVPCPPFSKAGLYRQCFFNKLLEQLTANHISHYYKPLYPVNGQSGQIAHKIPELKL